MDKFFAALVVAVCLLMLARLGLGAHRRGRLDAALSRWGSRWLRGRRRERPGLFASRAQREAEQVAREAIRRARERAAGEWDGNVFRTKTFRRRDGKKNIH